MRDLNPTKEDLEQFFGENPQAAARLESIVLQRLLAEKELQCLELQGRLETAVRQDFPPDDKD